LYQDKKKREVETATDDGNLHDGTFQRNPFFSVILNLVQDLLVCLIKVFCQEMLKQVQHDENAMSS
jgi:hypothetical protein